MKDVNNVITELAKKAVDSGLTQHEWLDYLCVLVAEARKTANIVDKEIGDNE